jgi:hypothetical protein
MQTTSVKEASGEAASSSASQRPETFRLPKPPGGDRYFGLTRSCYYRGEELGYWTLLRIRERGKRRGITLVPYDEVAAFIHAQSKAAANANKKVATPGRTQEPNAPCADDLDPVVLRFRAQKKATK